MSKPAGAALAADMPNPIADANKSAPITFFMFPPCYEPSSPALQGGPTLKFQRRIMVPLVVKTGIGCVHLDLLWFCTKGALGAG